MKIELILYLINFVHNVDTILSFFIVIPIIVTLIALFVTYLIAASENEKYLLLTILQIKKYLGWYMLMVIISSFVPSEKTMYLIFGANYFKNSNLPPKIEAIIEKKLDEYLIAENKEK